MPFLDGKLGDESLKKARHPTSIGNTWHTQPVSTQSAQRDSYRLAFHFCLSFMFSSQGTVKFYPENIFLGTGSHHDVRFEQMCIRKLGDLMMCPYLPNPSARAGYETRSIFKQSLTGLNSEFSFSYTSCLTKAEELSLSYYLPIAGRRIIRFIPFPRVLVLCEMQSASSRIWTRVTVSISCPITITPRAPPVVMSTHILQSYGSLSRHTLIYFFLVFLKGNSPS